MRKPVLGILGFSDGDKAAHEMLKPIVQAQVDAIAEALKKDGHISEDEVKKGEDAVQKKTDQYVKEIDSLIVAKEKEIMSI